MGNLRKSKSLSLWPVFIGLICVFSFVAVAAQQGAPAGTTQAPGGPVDPKADEQRLGLAGPANPKLPSLFLVGDSTVRNGHGMGSDGLWGWGAPIADLFDATKINVVNRAIGGLSSHTYISAGHWDSTLEMVKPGDFVLIQFGHNDGGLNLPGAAPVPDQGLRQERLRQHHRRVHRREGRMGGAACRVSATRQSMWRIRERTCRKPCTRSVGI